MEQHALWARGNLRRGTSGVYVDPGWVSQPWIFVDGNNQNGQYTGIALLEVRTLVVAPAPGDGSRHEFSMVVKTYGRFNVEPAHNGSWPEEFYFG